MRGCVCNYTYLYVCVDAWVCMQLYILVCVWMRGCVCNYTYLYVCVCVGVYVTIHTCRCVGVYVTIHTCMCLHALVTFKFTNFSSYSFFISELHCFQFLNIFASSVLFVRLTPCAQVQEVTVAGHLVLKSDYYVRVRHKMEAYFDYDVFEITHIQLTNMPTQLMHIIDVCQHFHRCMWLMFSG